MPSVVHFEIAVDNPERAIKFYSSFFGWKIQKWEQFDYWLASTKDEGELGIDGALMKREMAEQNIINTIEVPSIGAFMIKIKENDGTVLTPKMAIPGVGYSARCRDTEGNIFGILETDKTAR
jgi:predicted enzyme related to lactoylglutathione lyase